MKKLFLALALFMFFACSEVEVKPDRVDSYAGDPVSITDVTPIENSQEVEKERGITIN